MFKKDVKAQTAECEGTITANGRLGGSGTAYVDVAYEVGGVAHTLREPLKAKSEFIKLGPIPIGQMKKPAMPETNVGATVAVLYDPSDSASAHLRDNVGRFYLG